MAFVINWQKKLGYKSDPFVATPQGKTGAYLVERQKEQEKLNLFLIKEHRFGTLYGEKGAGCTTLLRWLEEAIKESHKIKVLSFYNKEARNNTFKDLLLNATTNIIERRLQKEKLTGTGLIDYIIKRIGTQKLLLIIDNAEMITKENVEILGRILEECPNTQLLLSVEKELQFPFGPDKLKLKVGEMDTEQLSELLKKRIALVGGIGTHPFDKKELEKLIGESKKNPVKLLELAQERAIELSLTAVLPIPKKEEKKVVKKEAAPVEKKESATPEEKKSAKKKKEETPVEKEPAEEKEHGITKVPKKKWFSIKFAKEEDLKKEKNAPRRKSAPEQLDEELLREHPDTEMLSRIVNQKIEEGEEKGEDINEILSNLVEEIEIEKKKR